MSNNIKFKRVTDNVVELADGSISEIFEIFPEDCEQKNSRGLGEYYSQVTSYLHSYEPDKAFPCLKMYKLDGRMYFNTAPGHLNDFPLPFKKAEGHFDYFFNNIPIKKSIVINKDDYVKLNSNYFRLVSVYQNYPEFINPNAFDWAGDFVTSFRKHDTDSAIRKLSFSRNIFKSDAAKATTDIDAINAYTENEAFIIDIKEGREKLFTCETFFIIKSDTEENLKRDTDKLLNNLRSLGVSFHIECEGLTKLFPTMLFGVPPSMIRGLPVKTSYLNNLLPLTRDVLFDAGSCFLSRSQNPMYINFFDDSCINFNILITGDTGTGKSVFAQKIFMDSVKEGAGGIIFDLGMSSLYFAQYFGAQVFSESHNPMQFRNPEYLHAYILSMIPAAEINAKTSGQILRLVNEALEEGVQTFRELVNFIELQIKDISYYFEPLWKYITNEEVEMHNFIYVDTTKYPKNIIAPLLVYLLEYFDQFEGRRYFMFDECWSFLETVGSHIEEKFRTIRKSGGGAIAISQNIDDFTGTPIGKAISRACYHKIILSQTTSDKEFLSEQEDRDRVKQVCSVKGYYSEFLYFTQAPDHRKFCQYHQDIFENKLFTSKKEEKVAMENYINSMGDGLPFEFKFDSYLNAII